MKTSQIKRELALGLGSALFIFSDLVFGTKKKTFGLILSVRYFIYSVSGTPDRI